MYLHFVIARFSQNKKIFISWLTSTNCNPYNCVICRNYGNYENIQNKLTKIVKINALLTMLTKSDFTPCFGIVKSNSKNHGFALHIFLVINHVF